MGVDKILQSSLSSPSLSASRTTQSSCTYRSTMLANTCGLHFRPCYSHAAEFSHSGTCQISLSSYCPRFHAFTKPKLSSLSLLRSKKNGKSLVTRALTNSAEPDSVAASDGIPSSLRPFSVKIPVGDRHVSLRNFTFRDFNVLTRSLWKWGFEYNFIFQTVWRTF